MSECCCQTCCHWKEPVRRWGCHKCEVQEHATGPLDRCDEYEADVPFADAMGSDAELDAKEAGNE